MAEQEKYSDYSFEDFLQDDFFIEFTKRPTEESVAFWDNFLNTHPEQVELFQAAQRFVEDLVQLQLSDKAVAGIWANIQMKIRSTRSYGKIRKIAYSSVAIAASITVLLVARIFFMQQNDRDRDLNDIMVFVGSQVDYVSNSGDVQLILSEQKTVVLQGKESVITYDSAFIHTNSEKISKNDVASYNQLMVPYGKNSILTLHDGTKIWVNAGTMLVYPVEFEKDKREIYANGEIFLDVAPDSERPFIVRTNDFRVYVVGTRFNVQAYTSDEQSRIALESGLVKIVFEAADDVLLRPNKVYEQDKSGHSSVKDADIEQYTSWIHGLYMYESERLDVILKRLGRYYGTEIMVDPSVSEIKCSGKLDLKENVEDVLSIISKTAPVKYIKNSEHYAVNYQTEKK